MFIFLKRYMASLGLQLMTASKLQPVNAWYFHLITVLSKLPNPIRGGNYSKLQHEKIAYLIVSHVRLHVHRQNDICFSSSPVSSGQMRLWSSETKQRKQNTQCYIMPSSADLINDLILKRHKEAFTCWQLKMAMQCPPALMFTNQCAIGDKHSF